MIFLTLNLVHLGRDISRERTYTCIISLLKQSWSSKTSEMQYYISEALIGSRRLWCSAKKLFLKILQNLQKNTSAKVSSLINFQASIYNFIKKGYCTLRILRNFQSTFLIENLGWLLLIIVLTVSISVLHPHIWGQ